MDDLKELNLDTTDPAVLSEKRGIYLRIAGHSAGKENVRIHYIADKKYKIDFI